MSRWYPLSHPRARSPYNFPNMSDSDLSTRQRLALSAFLGGANSELAATAANVTTRTVRRWLSSDAFRSALEREQSELTRAAGRRLASLLSNGVGALEDLLKAADLSNFERLAVVKVILQSYPKIHEITVIDDRLDRLQEVISGKSEIEI